ncbi:cold shock domain-containing protein [Crocinitomicaceae bacterium]|nr:cold shock domain-containing protein [Crocinitomicaceae bacterium]
MYTGKVKFFHEAKGFGFVVDEDSGREYFVHISGLIDAVKKNEKVSFELADGERGKNAVNVKLI